MKCANIHFQDVLSMIIFDIMGVDVHVDVFLFSLKVWYFSYFSTENMQCEYTLDSLEAPQLNTSNVYPQHKFLFCAEIRNILDDYLFCMKLCS